jgi:hypothetical protein
MEIPVQEFIDRGHVRTDNKIEPASLFKWETNHNKGANGWIHADKYKIKWTDAQIKAGVEYIDSNSITTHRTSVMH